jgi:hypothetical protein
MRLKATGQLQLNGYTSLSAFTGTGVAQLQVDASGNVITSAISSGGSGGWTDTGSDVELSTTSDRVVVGNDDGTSNEKMLIVAESSYNQGLRIETNASQTYDEALIAISRGSSNGIGVWAESDSYLGLYAAGALVDVALNGSGILQFGEIASTTTPTTSNGYMYAKTDNKPYYKNDSGVDYNLTSGSGNDFARFPMLQTDFLGAAGAATVEAAWGFDYAVIASGTQAKIAGEANHPGILRTSSSTTTNSGGYCLTDITSVLISGGEVCEVIFQPRVASNTNTTIRFGFMDATTATDAVDGCYFELPAGSLNIVGKTASNSTRSTTATVATLTVNTWYRAKVEVNSNASTITFTIYNSSGTSLGSQTLSANIPTATGRETGVGVIATNVGTTATLLAYWDMISFYYNKPLVR